MTLFCQLQFLRSNPINSHLGRHYRKSEKPLFLCPRMHWRAFHFGHLPGSLYNMHTQQMSPEQVSVSFGFERKRHPENKLCTVSLAQSVLPHRTIATLAIWPGLWCSFGPCLASRNAWNVSCQRHQLRQRCHLPGHSKATSFRTMLRGLRQGGTVGDVVKSQNRSSQICVKIIQNSGFNRWNWL